MIAALKKLKRQLIDNIKVRREFKKDFLLYKKYQYNNKKIHTKNALEAKIYRQTHVLEKGLSLSSPKETWGGGKAIELLDYIDELTVYGYKIEESSAAQNAIGVLQKFLSHHEQRGFFPTDIIERVNKLQHFLVSNKYENFGTVESTRQEMAKASHSEFPDFFMSRHSLRQFSDRTVDIDDIKKAVRLAMHSPSACNRQSTKVYFYSSADVNRKLGREILGNSGFEDEVKNYLVITGDLSSFYGSLERNQVYVNGGIFIMALVEALHYFGLASCILQSNECSKTDLQIKKVCGNIPENEKIIGFIAVGYYKESFAYAVSNRKDLDEILKIR